MSTIDKVEFVEVHGDDFLLGVSPFQSDRDNPLPEFLKNPTPSTGSLSGKQQLGQLLGNRTGTSRTLLAQNDRFYSHATQCLKIDSTVLIVTLILRGNKGFDQVWR